MTALTKTINYVQNTQTSLGLSNPLTATAGTVLSVVVTQLSIGAIRMGSFGSTVTTGVTSTYQTQSIDEVTPSITTYTGTVEDLNACLNAAYMMPHMYEADTIQQDSLSKDRYLPSDFRGEVQIQISPDCVHGLTVGSAVKLSHSGGGIPTRYIVTAIDSTNSATRIWMIYRSDYGLIDTYYNGAYKFPTINSMLQTDGGVNITPIVDYSFCNPHGNFSYTIIVKNTATQATISTDTMSFVGSFFIAEPVFATQPVAAIAAGNTEVTTSCNFGAVITQADNNQQSVQLLFKYYENDPMYSGAGTLQQIGDAIHNRSNNNGPEYITGTSMGMLGNTQVGTTTSTNPTDGVVRWYFNGTPAECTEALSKVNYFRPAGITQDIKVETRIVNGRTRIYSSRGN